MQIKLDAKILEAFNTAFFGSMLKSKKDREEFAQITKLALLEALEKIKFLPNKGYAIYFIIGDLGETDESIEVESPATLPFCKAS